MSPGALLRPDLEVYSLYRVTRPVLLSSVYPANCTLSPVAAVNSAMLVDGNVLEIVPLDPVVHEVPGVDHDLLSDNLCNHQVLLILDLRPPQAHVGPLGRNCKGRRGGGLSPVC